MRYYFADVTVDVDRRELRLSGQAVKARLKVFQLLLYLIDHRHRVVSKDEIHRHLWPQRIVSDATLTGCIKELRQAIGDSDRSRRLIRTIHGYGFQLASEVQVGGGKQPNVFFVVSHVAANQAPRYCGPGAIAANADAVDAATAPTPTAALRALSDNWT